MTQTAKLFMTGSSQAVRLPYEFRFDEKEVYIRRDPSSGDVILSRRPASWDDFFAMWSSEDAVPADFMSAEDRAQGALSPDPFGEVSV